MQSPRIDHKWFSHLYQKYDTTVHLFLAIRSRKKKREGEGESNIPRRIIPVSYRGMLQRIMNFDRQVTRDGRGKGCKPLRTLSRGTRRAEFGPNEKASAEKRSERSEAFTGCLRGPSVTLTPSKCNNIYIRAQPRQRVGRAPEMLRKGRPSLTPFCLLVTTGPRLVPQISIAAS